MMILSDLTSQMLLLPLEHAGGNEDKVNFMMIDDNCDDTDECENDDDIIRRMPLSH